MLLGTTLVIQWRPAIILKGLGLVIASGSTAGTFSGGQLLGLIPNGVLLPLLAALLVISALKVWTHK
jgi:uncharacterized protein